VGIFTSTSGVAPNRIFNIEYRTSYYNTNTMLNYEVRLYEGQTAFDVIYGTIVPIGAANDSQLAVGVQKDTTLFTSVGCDPTGGQSPFVSSGQRYHYTLGNCVTPTPTPIPCALGAWTTAANYPLVVESTAIGTDGTYVYSAGGFTGTPSTAFYRYDPVANTWTSLAPLPAAVYDAHGAYAANTNAFYVFGGYNGSAVNTTQRYNVATNAWSAGAAMPAARLWANVAYYSFNGKIYVIGGLDAGFVEQSQTWEYDPVADTWNTSRANDTIAQGGSGTVISGQYIYLMGGYGGGAGSAVHNRYDILGNTWAGLAALPVPNFQAGAGNIAGRNYLFGGGNLLSDRPEGPNKGPAGLLRAPQRPDTTYNSTYVYDIAGNSWTTGPNLTSPHSYTGGTAIGNRLLLVAGYNGTTGDTNIVEVNAVVGCPSISGTISYCSNPVPGPVPNVTLNLTGSISSSTFTNVSGNYTLSALPSGGNYTVTPTKAARMPGSGNINTGDVIGVQKQFLTGTFLTGCRLMAADVNGDGMVNTVDVIAIQRFYLGLTTGIANVGRYKFMPANRPYAGLVTNQTAQNYDALVFGDVASSFVERVDGPAQSAPAPLH
jgi:N-acetylneuraminic acid mutarotase